MKNLHTSKKEEESVLVFFIYYVIVDDKDNEIFRGNLISDENAYKINKSANGVLDFINNYTVPYILKNYENWKIENKIDNGNLKITSKNVCIKQFNRIF